MGLKQHDLCSVPFVKAVKGVWVNSSHTQATVGGKRLEFTKTPFNYFVAPPPTPSSVLCLDSYLLDIMHVANPLQTKRRYEVMRLNSLLLRGAGTGFDSLLCPIMDISSADFCLDLTIIYNFAIRTSQLTIFSTQLSHFLLFYRSFLLGIIQYHKPSLGKVPAR